MSYMFLQWESSYCITLAFHLPVHHPCCCSTAIMLFFCLFFVYAYILCMILYDHRAFFIKAFCCCCTEMQLIFIAKIKLRWLHDKMSAFSCQSSCCYCLCYSFFLFCFTPPPSPHGFAWSYHLIPADLLLIQPGHSVLQLISDQRVIVLGLLWRTGSDDAHCGLVLKWKVTFTSFLFVTRLF